MNIESLGEEPKPVPPDAPSDGAASLREPAILSLVEQAKKGDRAAFATLIDNYYDFIYRIAYKWLGQQSDAEDVAQDVVVKLAHIIQSFDGRSAFTTWLYPIVLNMLRDRHRKQARQKRNVEAHAEPSSEAIAPEQDAALASNDLWRAVRSLPDKQRDAVLLVYAEDLNHAEAAAVLGCKEATISWHVHEAKKMLRKLV